MPSNDKQNNALKQGSILAVASLVVRMIGMLYKIPLTYIIGSEGMTYYNAAYEIYNIALILSSLSIPLAVSKLISASDQKKTYKYSGQIFKCAMLLSYITGGIAGLSVLIFADKLAAFMEYPSAAPALKVLGPTIFLVAVLGVIRGLFQGKKNMVPTALSQVFEQVINAIVSIVAAVLFMVGTVDETGKASLGASGGTVGTFCGALSAVLFMFFIYTINKDYFAKKEASDPSKLTQSNLQVMKIVFLTMLPIILSQLVYQASGIIDTKIFGMYMSSIGESESNRAIIYEAYSNKFRQLTNIPIAIATALSAAIVPTLSGLLSVGNHKEIRNKIGASIKLNMIIAIPAAVGMGVLGPQIVYLLYGTNTNGVMGGSGGQLLRIGSVAIVFFAFSTMTNGILQGVSHMKTPVINAAISLVVHIGLLFFMLYGLELGVYALVIGNATFAFTVCVLNWICLKRYAGYKQEIYRTFICPLISSAFMGVGVLSLYTLIYNLLSKSGKIYVSNLVATLISIVFGVFVYFLCLALLRTATEEELKEYPMGMRFIRILRKLKLLTYDEQD